MSLPLDPQTLPIAATGFPAPIERHWDTLCRNNLGQLVDGNGVVVAIEAGAMTGDGNARFKTSVRVGSGAGLVADDGGDGTVILSGALAQIVLGNIAAPAGGNYVAGYRNGATFVLASNENVAGFAIFDVTTGRVTQEAVRSVAGESRYVNGWGNLSGYTVGFYKDSCGRVHLRGLAAGGTVAPGTTIFTLPSGYFGTTNPLAVFPVVSAGLAAGIQITNAGNVQTLFGVSNAYVTFDGISFDPRA